MPLTVHMTPSGRKSSLASSRNGPKKYIPYRADDFQHGKKTGITVETVDHTDEFEPFEKVMSQADKHTPYRVQNTRKKRIVKTPIPQVPQYDDDDDEYGEISMDLDESARLTTRILYVFSLVLMRSAKALLAGRLRILRIHA